jgi:hypothetical protein
MSKIMNQSILLRSLLSIGSCVALLALMTMLSQAQPGPISPSPNPVERPNPNSKPNPPLPVYLEILRTTKYWENKFVGSDYQPSKVFGAFQKAYQAGEKNRSELEQILRTGTPAGKMYAVVILADFDPEAAKQVLEKMRNDDTVVLERTGDLTTPKKVSIWAVSTLQGMEMQPYHVALPPNLATLREATRLEGQALGEDAFPSKIYQAFEQASQPGQVSRSNIDRLLHESTPAGRIYTAMLLVKLNPKAGRQLLEKMKSDQTALTEAFGCTTAQTSVGAAVEDILQGRSRVFPPLP